MTSAYYGILDADTNSLSPRPSIILLLFVTKLIDEIDVSMGYRINILRCHFVFPFIGMTGIVLLEGLGNERPSEYN